ncbi:MAG TPA: hypothetical protein VGF26_01325, partial [Ramlibacter sp.]
IDARGPLAPVAASKGLLSIGLIVSPQRGAQALAQVQLEVVSGPGLTPSRAQPGNAALVAGNSTESCLPFVEVLALGGTHDLVCLATPTLGLKLHVEVL